MAKIIGVKLEGYQSHVETAVNLSEGLTVITGASDAGKTSIIRAVRWVAFNEPKGEAFVNEEVGYASVELKLDSGFTIGKLRKSGKTSYTIDQPDGHQQTFEKAEVPEEVTRLLGVEKQAFGDFEAALNFAYQLEAPFLISETASAGAKVMGKLAGTEAVDRAVKGISKDTYAARQERSTAEKEIERIHTDMLDYQGIDDAEKDIKLAERIYSQIEQDFEKLNKLKDWAHRVEGLQTKIQVIAAKLERLAAIPDIAEDMENIEKAQQRYDTLIGLYSKHSRLSDKVDTLEVEISAYAGTDRAAEYVTRLERDEQTRASLTSLYKSYQDYTEKISQSLETIEKTEGTDEAADLMDAIGKYIESARQLRRLQINYNHYQTTAQQRQTTLDGLEGVQEGTDVINATAGLYDRLTTLYNLKKRFEDRDDLYKRRRYNLDVAEKDLQAAQQELNETWEAAGGICPLCEQPMEGGHDHA